MLGADDVQTIAEGVLSTMLQLESQLEDAQPWRDDAEHMSGVIQIGGQWTGAVQVITTWTFAADAASRMLTMEANELSHDDVTDTLAELTNMISGGIKSLLPGPSQLSLPCVTSDKNPQAHQHDGAVVCTSTMLCAGEPIMIKVLQATT